MSLPVSNRISNPQRSRIEDTHPIVLALPDFACAWQSCGELGQLFHESSSDRVLIAVTTGEGGAHRATRDGPNRNAAFFCLLEKRVAHSRSLPAVHELFLNHDRTRTKLVHQSGKFQTRGNLHRVNSLPKTLDSPIDESCGTFEYNETETARAQVNC